MLLSPTGTANPITDLTESDFEVYENRKKQTIQSFSQEIYQNPQSSMTWAAKPERRTGAGGGPDNPAVEPGHRRPDLSRNGHPQRTVEAIRGFVERGLKEQDYISIMTASRGHFVPSPRTGATAGRDRTDSHKKLDFTQALRRRGCVTLTDAQAEEIEVFAPVPGNRAFDVAMRSRSLRDRRRPGRHAGPNTSSRDQWKSHRSDPADR